ncbi:MAG: hypothetical protein E6649_05245 [Paeniclostridium sordellii]|nr:hypothetical protein [Paeniclostridium sordellii]DAP48654.1 MAG TPA: RNA polymerase-like protein [Caudoviricetes sp.]
MKKLKLYKKVVRKYGKLNYDWDMSPIFKTIEVNDDFDIWSTPILINNTFYTVSSSQGNNFKIVELEYFKFDEDIDDLETFGEDEITCPVCGSKQSDSWEYSCYSDTNICDDCGSEYDWSREVEVTYNSQATKIGEHIEIE